MKKRWLLNLVMLLVVASLVTFLYVRPQPKAETTAQYEISTLKLTDFKAIQVEFPTKSPVSFEKIDGLWRLTAPYKMRADQLTVQRILSIIAAKSKDKYPASDLGKYGLDNPQLRLKLTNTAGEQVFSFGTFNPVTEEQYVNFNNAVYLLPVSYSEIASTQAIELIDKSPMSAFEAKQVTGFNFAKLEQWEDVRMSLDLDNGQWKTNVVNAKPAQNELNEWLDFAWKQNAASSVEIYTPDRKIYPSFEIKLKDGKKIHFDKIQESPELLLARADEGLIYHFTSDAGFGMLNPPLNIVETKK
jgi:Domain of unknown function (DUF4340)